jgi:hypothetical protein
MVQAWLKQFGSTVEFQHFGFRGGRYPISSTNGAGGISWVGYTWWIEIPVWAIIIPCGLVPIFLVIWHRKREQREDRIRRGLCISCGYDLRATPGSLPGMRGDPNSSRKINIIKKLSCNNQFY